MAITSFRDKYEFLSNFHMHPILYDGEIWPSTEHAYQAMKTLNKKEREHIKNEPMPGKAKQLGKTVLLREDWEDIKIDIMRQLLRLKFNDPKLKRLLLDTGNEELIEGNVWKDTFWGVYNGIGQNWLGKLLMEIRDEINKSILEKRSL